MGVSEIKSNLVYYIKLLKKNEQERQELLKEYRKHIGEYIESGNKLSDIIELEEKE